MSPKAIKKNPICEKLHNLVTLLIGEFIEADKRRGRAVCAISKEGVLYSSATSRDP